MIYSGNWIYTYISFDSTSYNLTQYCCITLCNNTSWLNNLTIRSYQSHKYHTISTIWELSIIYLHINIKSTNCRITYKMILHSLLGNPHILQCWSSCFDSFNNTINLKRCEFIYKITLIYISNFNWWNGTHLHFWTYW